MLRLIIYSKPGCHLCDEMKATVARAGRSMPLSLEDIDISADPALEARYGLGKKVAKFRIGEQQLLRLLADTRPT